MQRRCWRHRPSVLFCRLRRWKRGFIDATGVVVIEPRFDGAAPFSNGLAKVAFHRPKNREGYIDRTGRLAFAAHFDRARDFSEGLAAVGFGEFELHGGGDHVWGFIDTSGQLVIEPRYRRARGFREGAAAVLGDNNQWSFLGRDGEVIVPFLYDSVMDFSMAWQA